MQQHPTEATVAGIAWAVLAAPPRCGAVRLLCIDGPAGSGKTTLAASVATELDGRGTACAVVHLDDLYEGWKQPLGSPLAARVDSWLLIPWRDGLPGRHLHFDWSRDRYVAWTEVPPPSVAVVEGCGAGSRDIRGRASLVVWVEADPEVRLARGVARDGDDQALHWRRWQQTEAEHFGRDGTRAAADVLLRT